MSVEGFTTSNSVSLANGSKTIEVTGDVNCSFVISGTAVLIDGLSYVLEGVEGSAADIFGDSTITLRNAFTGTNIVNGKMTIFNTIEGLRDAQRLSRYVVDDAIALQGSIGTILTGTDEFVDITVNEVVIPMTPYGYLKAQLALKTTEAASLITTLTALSATFTDMQSDVQTAQNDLASINGTLTGHVADASGSEDNAEAWAESDVSPVYPGAPANSESSKAWAGKSSTSASNSSTSEGNASTSASNASTSENNASNSASAASTSEGNASTSAGNASTSASNSSGSASAASTSANNASTSESNASTSASNSSGSASNASTSEGNASTSESNAATSAAEALAYRNAAQSAAGSVTSQMFFVGNFDASSGTPPTQPASGSAVYRVDVAGTINNMTLSENDVLYYDQVEDAGETSWRSVGGKSYSIQDGELSQKNFTTEKDDKLTDIAENANNYSHPDNHAASMITQDATHRFASDTEKTAWNTAPTPSGIGALALTGGNVVGATKVTAGTTELDVSTTGVKVTGVFEINNVDILARIAEVEVLTLAAMALAGG